MYRREFLQLVGTLGSSVALRAANGERVCLVLNPRGSFAVAGPVGRATAKLEQALRHAGYVFEQVDRVRPEAFNIEISEMEQRAYRPEALRIERTRNGVAVSGSDARALGFALLELADRVSHGMDLNLGAVAAETPCNNIRSVMRQFTSELLDKPWFYDRDGWREYLDMLATHRWNRLHLAFGLGYDSLNRVDDAYFLFFYPFVVSVPGYNVRVSGLSESEREQNLDTIQFIARETVARGLDFELGIWMHGYKWREGTAQYRTEGLDSSNHAAYCRDALTTVLKVCPEISSVALRIHGESGIAEGSYDFWATVFEGVQRSGRAVEIDLHAKGLDQQMIDHALATGMPVNVSPTFSAEHFGMPYHQARIREIEMPVAGHKGSGLMKLSEGARVFTRYGYADFLRRDRRYTVRPRVFSGTQRILLWADPAWAAAYSRAFGFCGCTGVDLMEPLSCRGRRGSAVPGTRTGYKTLHSSRSAISRNTPSGTASGDARFTTRRRHPRSLGAITSAACKLRWRAPAASCPS